MLALRRRRVVPVFVQGGGALIHLAKLCVGVSDVAELAAWQAGRQTPVHHTRNMPRRAAELLDGGSLYWVIAGQMTVRQRVLAVRSDRGPGGVPCATLVLDPVLVSLIPRPVRAFQGWRYLKPADAPADLNVGDDVHALSPELRRELAALGLL